MQRRGSLHGKPGAVHTAPPGPPGRTWTPKQPGERLFGYVLGFGQSQTQYGLAQTATLESESGARRIYLSRVLESKFEELDVQPGCWVRLTYLGRHPRGWHQWSVEAGRADAPPPAPAGPKRARQRKLPALAVPTDRPAPPDDPDDPFCF